MNGLHCCKLKLKDACMIIERAARPLAQVGIQIRLVEGFSLEIRMHSESIRCLLLLMQHACSNTGLRFSSYEVML